MELLLAQAEKQKEINRRLEASVFRVNDIAKRLDEAMGPVYNDTQSLSVVTNSETATPLSDCSSTDFAFQTPSESYQSFGGR